MEKLRQWFTRPPSPPGKAASVPVSPSKPPHWSPYVWLSPDRPNPNLRPRPAAPFDPSPPRPGTPAHLQMPDLSLRKRLVRLPTGDDALLVGDGLVRPMPSSGTTVQPTSLSPAFQQTAASSVRRSLQAQFAALPLADTTAHTQCTQVAWPGPLAGAADYKHSPLREAKYPQPQESSPRPAGLTTPVPASLQALLERDGLTRSDYAALRSTLLSALLRPVDSLSPAGLDAFAQALAQRVMRAGPSPSRGMVQLIEQLLSPLDTRLPHHHLGALTHGLAQACRELAKADAPPGTPRGLSMARDHLSRHVARSRDRLGLARHAIQACALARVAGPGESNPYDTSPQGFGRLLAQDPAAALWYPDSRLNDVERLGLFNAALSMPPGITSRAHAARLGDRLLAGAPARLRGMALACLLDAARDQLTPGTWPMQHISAGTFSEMVRHLLQAGVQQYLDAADSAQREEEDPAASPLAARRLMAREVAALDEVVENLVGFFMSFDVSREPVFLRGRAGWLRQMAAPGARPEVAVVARAVADALERRAGALSAPLSPDLP